MKRTKRILSVVLCLVMVLAAVPVMQVGMKAKAAGTTLADMRARAEAIVNYSWTPSQNIYTWNGNSYNGRTYFAKDESVKGVPYTLFTSEVVPWSLCSLEEYKDVASSNYSATEYCASVGETRTGPVYGSCCADLVCEVFGGDFMNGSTMRYHNVGAVQRSDYATTTFNVKASSIVAGDALSDTGKNHIIWVSEVTDSGFIIYEQTPPVARKTTISKSSVNSSEYLVYGGRVYSTVTKSKAFSPVPPIHDPVNLGDEFYARIINTDAWMPATNDGNNVSLRSSQGAEAANQNWYFYRKDDGSYSIRSASSGLHLTADGTSSGSNIKVAAWTGSDSQYWWITGESAKYVLTPKSSSCSLTVKNGSYAEGTNIQLGTTVKDDAQLFQIWTSGLEDYMMSPNVRTNQSVYTHDSKITLSWNQCLGASSYRVIIWKAGENGENATPIFSQDVGQTYSYTINSLENGNYTIYVTASGIGYGSSNCKIIVADNTFSDTPADLGDDFYAVILTWNEWKPIANDYEVDSLVRLQTGEHEKNSAHQLWRFQRQSDGSYAIRSLQDAHCLEFDDNTPIGDENHPVSADNVWWNGACQKWWIYKSSNGGYFFKSSHYSSQGWYMTLKDDNSEDGTPITMCSLTRKDNQSWGIYKGNEVQLKAPTVTAQAGTSVIPTQFTWNHVFGAKEFKIDVWANQYTEGKAPDYTNTVTDTNSNIQLPAGTYEASVTASNYWQSFTSQRITFTVEAEHIHSYTSSVTKVATCTETGIRTFSCICGDSYTEPININSSNHVNTTNVAATASTCTVKGYSAGIYCNDCKKYISGHQEQPLAAHTLTTINKKDAGCTTTGYTGDQYCTVCKQTISKGSATNALGHTSPDGNGNCTRCGTHIKDVTPPQPQPNPNACKYCGEVHSGPFGWLIKFFHSILAIFKR